MHRYLVLAVLACLVSLSLPGLSPAAEPGSPRKEVIYGRKFGTALTMDVFTPKKDANGAGVIFIVSGGWFSDHNSITPLTPVYVQPFLARGYTVFAVVHGSSPKYSIPEILEDLHRAVRFIRHNAREYGIDGDRLGITGGSAGGHLSLMQGCAPREGNAKASDPVERESSKVQAVGCFYPPTDFLNWGEKGKVMLGKGVRVPVQSAFEFRQLDPKNRLFEPITKNEEREEIGKKISPISHVGKNNPPTLIIHGDQDDLVPIQQAETMINKLKEAGVVSELIVKKGGKHDGALVVEYLPRVVDWFDKHLAKKGANSGNKCAIVSSRRPSLSSSSSGGKELPPLCFCHSRGPRVMGRCGFIRE